MKSFLCGPNNPTRAAARVGARLPWPTRSQHTLTTRPCHGRGQGLSDRRGIQTPEERLSRVVKLPLLRSVPASRKIVGVLSRVSDTGQGGRDGEGVFRGTAPVVTMRGLNSAVTSYSPLAITAGRGIDGAANAAAHLSPKHTAVNLSAGKSRRDQPRVRDDCHPTSPQLRRAR
jgi:hypothetical protein